MSFKSVLAQKPDYLVCVCMGVMYHDILVAIERGDRTFKQLQDALMVGTGCASCHEEVRQILDKSLNS